MASEESVGGIRTRSTIKTTLVTFEFVANLEGRVGRGEGLKKVLQNINQEGVDLSPTLSEITSLWIRMIDAKRNCLATTVKKYGDGDYLKEGTRGVKDRASLQWCGACPCMLKL